MIIVGIGSNLAASGHDSPLDTGLAALDALAAPHLHPIVCSPWYESAPVPASDQPWFANAVVLVDTEREPEFLLDWLQAIETRFGRERGERNAARTLDLDLIDYDGLILDTPRLVLPHPRMHERRFVLAPLCDLAPGWRHPRLGVTATELLAGLPPGQPVRRAGLP
jgi:2-amino-4-hydroxy-6-hydroxymethyldihydropteridine diphosphokinase